MSALDYLDGDVSDLIGVFLIKLRYSRVVQQFKHYVDLNIHLQYLQHLQYVRYLQNVKGKIRVENFIKHNRKRHNKRNKQDHPKLIHELCSDKELVHITNTILKTKHKTSFIHDWPNKPPTFVVESLYPTLDIYNAIHFGEVYVTDFGDGENWVYKSYPPDPDKYSLLDFCAMCRLELE